MARHRNLWIGNGYLGRDPEIRYTNSGKAVCSISMGCSFDDKTEWINLVFWEKAAELVGQHCAKGSFIEVTGRIQTRSWEKDGVTRYTTEIVASDVQFLGSRDDTGQAPVQQYQTPQDSGPGNAGFQPSDPADDGIPF